MEYKELMKDLLVLISKPGGLINYQNTARKGG